MCIFPCFYLFEINEAPGFALGKNLYQMLK